MKISYEDLKLGDVITYYLNAVGSNHSPNQTAFTHQGTVIAIPKKGSMGHYVVGWKQDPMPFASGSPTSIVMASSWAYYNLMPFDFEQYTHYDTINFSSDIECLARPGSGASVSSVQEKPCVGCSAMNDVGVKVCWRCGGIDPTQSGKFTSSVIRRGYI